MLLTSHLLATLLGAKALRLSPPETYAALASGVGVDLDHLFVNKKWMVDVKDFMREGKVTYGVNQHSWIQEFLFGTLAASAAGALLALASSIRWWVLPLFLLGHIALDAVMRNAHHPFVPFNRYKYVGWIRSGTVPEILISCLGLLWLIYKGI
jgi:hypothetical protein